MGKTGTFGITKTTSGGGAVTIIGAAQTPSAIDISAASGNTLVTWRSMTFVVVAGTMVIGGVTVPTGSYTYDNDTFGTLNVIAYDATLSTNAFILIQI